MAMGREEVDRAEGGEGRGRWTGTFEEGIDATSRDRRALVGRGLTGYSQMMRGGGGGGKLRQSLHLLRTRLCSQMEPPPHSLQ